MNEYETQECDLDMAEVEEYSRTHTKEEIDAEWEAYKKEHLRKNK